MGVVNSAVLVCVLRTTTEKGHQLFEEKSSPTEIILATPVTQRRICKYITQSCIVCFWFIRDYAVICSRCKSVQEQREHLIHTHVVVQLYKKSVIMTNPIKYLLCFHVVYGLVEALTNFVTTVISPYLIVMRLFTYCTI